MRHRDTKTKAYRSQRIALADDGSKANGHDILNFEQALELAEATYNDIIAGAPDGPTLTVEEAAYGVTDSRSGKRSGGYIADREADGQDPETAIRALEAHILPRWRETRIADLTVADLRAWRDELVRTAPRARTSRFADQQHVDVDLSDPETGRRRRSTVNRITTTFKAILNYAARMDPAQAPNREAWREGLKAFREVDRPRERWLTSDEVVRLLNACRPDFRRLVQAAVYTGCRYGELCRAKVGHYNSDLKALHVPTSKSGKSRDVILHDEAAAFFESITIGRTADEWLLTRSDPVLVAVREGFSELEDWTVEAIVEVVGNVASRFDMTPGNVGQRLQLALKADRKVLGQDGTLNRLDSALAEPWGRSQQSRMMAEACKAANIKPPIGFHGLRHTHCSIAVQSGMALMALAANLGHANTRMVEKHYGHLNDEYMRKQVEAYAPKFGIDHQNGNVRSIRGRKGR